MFVGPVTGRVGCITCGGPDIGDIDTASESGYTAITSHEDTNPFHVGGLPGRDHATRQAEKSAREGFKKIVAP